jgi:nucleoside-diphosphate-sugar epimerase
MRDLGTGAAARNGAARLGRRIVVTGCAGFLGSHLSERLVAGGRDVLGVDCFTDYYSREIKEGNLERLRDEPRFTFQELDLSVAGNAQGLLEGADVVIHLAAQAGVRGSFGEGFATYLRHNVSATQALLEEAVRHPVMAFTYASSSSVYGNAPSYPTREESPRRPVSPYGMTKVATEELAGVYHRTYGVPVVGLRYFTAYGPRQRPDMAFTRFLTRAIRGRPLPVIGDGRQIRDFTFVDDVVDGTIAAACHGRPGSVYNIGGGRPVELRQAIGMIEHLLGRRIELQRRPAQVGEAQATGCDGSRARQELGYAPRTSLEHGLAAQLKWVLTGVPAPELAFVA